MLACYVILDVETTGGNPQFSRVTEVAAVRVEHGWEVARWSSLVNPGMQIPYFITRLTGISNEMVEDAPTFEKIAPELLALLDGAVLVAHNVRFDHSFLVHEFARAGIALNTSTLCTVRLSRKLYPQARGHGLDALMQRHGLTTANRHRAMGDVDLVQQWLQAAMQELGDAQVRKQAQQLLQGSQALPPQLETDMHSMPDTPGVYLFYGDGTIPLYIGKSITLRTRVMSHFQAATKVARELRMSQEIRRVEWRETAGELGALLLEARLVKELQPIFNRQLRRDRSLCSWQLALDPNDKPLLNLVRGDDLRPDRLSHMVGVYRSQRQAITALQALATEHKLCPQLLGLEGGTGRCFAHQIGHCKGACRGQESLALHYARVVMALAQHKLKAWPYAGKIAIKEHCAATGRNALHIFEHWCHLATVNDESELYETLGARQTLAFDLDTYRLCIKYLQQPGLFKHTTVIALPKLHPLD